jgi:hypothetical protein
MLVSIEDTLEITDATETSDGYLALQGRVARSGVYQYLGAELGFGDMGVVNVYRPESSVFDAASMASYAHKPVTNNHPSVNVSRKNWKDLSRGWSGGEIKRDGDHVSVPMILADEALISEYRAGKVELSPGYRAEVIRQDGELSDGTKYQFVMGPPKINHIAVVPKGRGGATCRLGDAWPDNPTNPRETTEVTLKTMIIDGLPVAEISASAEAVITRYQTKLSDADKQAETLTTEVKNLKDAVSAKEGEIAVLTKKLADAEITPEKLAALVADRAMVIDTARAVLGQNFSDAGKTDADIRRAVVAAQLGDEALDKAKMDDAVISGAFRLIAKDAKPASSSERHAPTMRVSDGGSLAELRKQRDAARSAHLTDLQTAHQGRDGE